ncbi:Zn-ribbon domain-containing OB-fold protein [Streptomyces palmae]|uniref:Zn-ribbon domain-containing OB-fold protein n=1 Tax=Streptomyces palmae TaxID=1701085 RepID=UPI0014328556|nr:zinc ribbon domain-containing protein [Streptomyces palmae]
MFHTVAEIADHPPVHAAPDTHGGLDPIETPVEGWPGGTYLQGLQRGELYYQRCRWCHTAVFHRLLCPICASPDMDWEHSSGMGVVRHATVVRRSSGSLRTVGVIDMAEGFRLRATLSVGAERVRPGTVVRLDPHTARPRELTFRVSEERTEDRSTHWR